MIELGEKRRIKKMTVGKRVKAIRKELGLSMDALGSAVGYTRSGISSIEHDVVTPSEIFIKSVCREFNVDYNWLKNGEGEMFLPKSDILIDSVIEYYSLNPNQKPLISAYLESDESTKENLLNLYLSIKKGAN